MSFKPKYFILFPYIMIENMTWPDNCDYRCAANLPSMLRQKLNVKTIGGEIKLIWNDEHRNIILKKNNITNEQLNDYIKSNSCMLSFLSNMTRKRVMKYMDKLNAIGYVCVENYRDVLLYQAFYQNNKKFPDVALS